MPCKKESQTVNMSIFSTEMSWGVSINVFRVIVSSSHQESLDNTEISSYTGNMQGSSEIFGPWVYNGSIFNEDLDELHVAFRCSHVKRSPAISIGAVNTNLSLVDRLRFKYL
jgi:hypothetical protein